MVNTTVAPLISVIIPSYNRGQLIERAVCSAFAQQNVEIEVIVVDDGSTDNTADVLASLKQKYGSALRIHTQPNLGASAARNAGLDLAIGDYVQFLDSDDTLEPKKIYLQLAVHLSNPSLSVVLCHGFLEESDGSERIICPNLGEDPQLYIERMCSHEVHVIQTAAPLWRRAFLTDDHRWSPKISLGDDLEFHARCFADIELVHFIGQPLFNVCAHAGDRLSDFSAQEDRLVALIKTRLTMHDVLKRKGRWSEICAQNMVVALRSIYVVYLQRMSILDILDFEQAALVMVGPRWRGFRLSVISYLRRFGGVAVVELTLKNARYLQALNEILAAKIFSWKTWAHRFRNITSRVRRFSMRDEIRSIMTLRDDALLKPDKRRVLFVEPNEFHAETIPGFVSLLAEAGFATTVIHRPSTLAADAVSRLPAEIQPRLFALTLWGMRHYLRSQAIGQYEFVMLGSGMLAEKFVYFGSVLDYLGFIPNGRRGHIVIEHVPIIILHRRDRFRAKHVFALRDTDVKGINFPMLAPVNFGKIAPAPLLKPVIFAVVGRFEPKIRDVEGLFKAVRELANTDGPAFRVDLIGDVKLSEIPDDIRPFFRSLGRISFADMYNTLDKAHFLLPLLDSYNVCHRIYLRHNTTGTRQLSLGFRKPMVMDSTFAGAYGFDARTAVMHTPGDLHIGLEQARLLQIGGYSRMQEQLEIMKSEVFSKSVENLRSYANCSGCN